METVEVLRIHLNAEGLSSLCIFKRLCFAARALVKVRPIEVKGAGARTDLNGAIKLRFSLMRTDQMRPWFFISRPSGSI